ncbi:alpha/beta fold hydrolase [Seohaeicola zhoushanensis]|uniref:AB hydrolase-1 domain-containing protein n=1 Tax=Seohaeicola zhoushanensis TaxID=1569283 RepID=A0A8J3GWD1_9RHOB|nr:alpha/beta fold hydrolase [Seohaeicola zhoushanensis]GHF48304.1 hypothetical protein GCM10017056_19810 [Seohaeicola zhoushanensis]
MTAHRPMPADRDAPVVALHTSMTGSEQWAPLAAQLASWYPVHAVDLPENAGTVAQTAARVAARIASFGRPVHLVGHSFGGAVALGVALQRPGLVRSLTLFEPAAFHVLDHGAPADRLLHAALRTRAGMLRAGIAAGEPDAAIAAMVDFWTPEGGWAAVPERMRAALAAHVTRISADLDRVLAETWRPESLAGLRIPALLLVGMDSAEVAIRTSAMVAAALPQAEIAMLPGLGHMAPVSAPDWVNPRIQQHIARVERAPARLGWPEPNAA